MFKRNPVVCVKFVVTTILSRCSPYAGKQCIRADNDMLTNTAALWVRCDTRPYTHNEEGVGLVKSHLHCTSSIVVRCLLCRRYTLFSGQQATAMQQCHAAQAQYSGTVVCHGNTPTTRAAASTPCEVHIQTVWYYR